jgi:hypothetical protein
LDPEQPYGLPAQIEGCRSRTGPPLGLGSALTGKTGAEDIGDGATVASRSPGDSLQVSLLEPARLTSKRGQPQ